MQFYVLSLLGGVGTGGWSSAKPHSPWVLTWALFYLPPPHLWSPAVGSD